MTSLDIITGIELGTTKICVMVAHADERDGLRIIGAGQCVSHGIRKGEVHDPTAAIRDLGVALQKAESMAGVDITRAYLGITGKHVKGITDRGSHPIRSRDHGVTPKDVEIVIKNARSFELEENASRLHCIQQNFKVDDFDNIKNPIGHRGHTLTVEMHNIQGAYTRIENSIHIVRQNNVDVHEVAFTGLASALACLGKYEKEHGALVIDIGAGATEYLLYTGGRVRHSGVIAVGGDHVTNDLNIGLFNGRSLRGAEDLKIHHGSALVFPECETKRVLLSSGIEQMTRDFSLVSIHRIMHLRLSEIFQIIRSELEKKKLHHHCQAGVVLSGGTAKTPHINQLASRIFNAQASRASARAIHSLPETLDQPEFMTCLGLLKFGSFQKRTEKRPVSTLTLPNFNFSLPGLFKKEAANN
ncbi:MAG: cell division protein FtsA [Verrucomicrobia bacterium]|nr:cell division protein FtsA [Verrucomicrobiota bacterium]